MSYKEANKSIIATKKLRKWFALVWVSVVATSFPSGYVRADWTFDSESYTFVLEPNLVSGDVFHQHWANEASNPATYLHSGNMFFDTRSWYDIDPNHIMHVLHSRGDYCGSTTFADYRVRSTEGNIYALRSTTWYNAYQPTDPLTLDHYNAYSSDDGSSYTDYFLDENWDGGCPPGTGWGCGGEPTHPNSAQAVIDSPGRITRLRYGVRDLNDWDEWYGASWRIWAGSTQTEYRDNYLTNPFAKGEGGPIWSSCNIEWISYNGGMLASSNEVNSVYCTYLVAHHGAMTGIDIRLTSTDLDGTAEALWTPSEDVHLHLAVATNEDGPFTDVYVGQEYVPNSANPGAYVDLVPYGKPEVLFVKIYSTKDAGDSYYIHWGGFHVQITAEDPPYTGPETCEQLWQQSPPDYNYPGNFDNDCEVNTADLALFADSWLLCNDPEGDPCCCNDTPYGLSADLNHDCIVDMKDFSFFADSWHQSCDSQVPTTTDRPFREILGVSGIGPNLSTIDFLTDLGVTWVRDGLNWHQVEMSPGVYCIPIWDRNRIDRIHEAGFKIILHFGYGNDIYDNPWDPNAYAAYAAFCVRRLRGKIQACHCINEPCNFGFREYYGGVHHGAPPSPWIAKYAELVRLTAAAAHEVAPEIPIMANEAFVVNHYRFLDEGLGPYVSTCSWHPYGGCDYFNYGWDPPSEMAVPYQVADEDGSRASLIRRLKQKGEDVTGKNFEIYCTEFGWAPDSPHFWVPDFQTAANYLVRSYIISYANNMKTLFWYTLQDPFEGFGLIDNEYNKRPTYYAYRNMAQTIGDMHLLRYVCDQQAPTQGVQAYLFGLDNTNEQNVLVLWSADDQPHPVTIYGIEPGAQILNSVGNTVGSVPAGPLEMTIDGEPHYIVGDISVDVLVCAELDKLLADDGAANDEFGYSVSLSGDYALIGAYRDNDNGDDSGSAYIFQRDKAAWIQRAKLTAADAAEEDRFGVSVSLDGDYALVGAYWDNDNGNDSGSAYIFKRSDDPNDPNWYQQTKLLADDGATFDLFGQSVSLSGNYALVGAYGDDDKGDNSGAAYIFKRSDDPNDPTWYQQAKLLADDGDDNDNFGRSVCLSGDYALVGAYGDDDNGYNSGSAYIFKTDADAWYQQAKLLADDADVRDRFGVSVSLVGDYALVGAFWDNDNGDDSGSAYIFKRDTDAWYQQAKLTAADGAFKDYFGRSLSLSGDYALVGAYSDDDNGTDSGSAYIFGCSTAD